MSPADEFDTDIGAEAEQAAPVETMETAEGEFPPEEAPPPSRSGFILKALAGVILLAAGGAYFVNVSGGAPPAGVAVAAPVLPSVAPPGPVQTSNTMAAAPEALPPDGTVLKAPVKMADASGTMDNSSSMLPPEITAASSQAGAPPAPAANEDPLAWGSGAPKAEETGAPALPLPPTSTSSMPLPTSIDVPPPKKEAPALSVSAPVPAAPPVAAARNAAPASPPPEKNETLEKRLTELEKKIDSLQKDMVKKEDLDSLRGEAKEEDVSRAPAGAKKARHKVKKAAVKKRLAAAPAPVAASWVLKAAKPGTAWVSEKGSNEMKTVSVGDALPEIGRIMAVAKDMSGRWVVTGTAGKISQ